MDNYKGLSELIDDTLYAIETIIQDFSKIGSEYIAFKLLSTLYEALEYILLAIPNSRIYIENRTICTFHNRITIQLNELLKCMENEDYILLCDILEYEILVNLKCMNNELKEALL